jgi:haloacid dehalogenase superfamily, subfamily IA, variant 3 with third motif having DD or ED/haloacid dehalogenase superfamily, subfamily IA, variant 1 with third motif having Dx(3-4)D or Dx(3-4)E
LENIKALFFDLDGTLVDSEPLKALSLSETMKHFGADVAPDVYKSVMGQSWERVLQEFFKHGEITISENEFNPIFREKYKVLIATQLTANAKLRSWLLDLKSQNLKLALVSSAACWMIDGILKQVKLEDIFDLIVSGDDVKKHKPDPEAYLLALKKLTLNPADVLIFEDSEAGILAARNSNIKAIALYHDYNRNHDFTDSVHQLENLLDARDFLKKNFKLQEST